MRYRILNGEIEIFDLGEFDAKHILDCGQVFRYSEENGIYKIIAKNSFSCLYSYMDRAIIQSSDVLKAEEYFDLKRDYSEIKSALSGQNPILDKAIEFGKGIRILRQDPVETIFSFIISANNNIPRIKGILERLCRELGDDMGGYFAFPTLEQLSHADEAFYRSIGAGYRAAYLKNTTKRLRTDFDIDLRGLSTMAARKTLMSLTGVGGKVADCILLFGYGRTDVFPMDVWTKRVYPLFGLPETTNPVTMAKNLTDRFGHYSGYAQQYLYYYYRENGLITK